MSRKAYPGDVSSQWHVVADLNDADAYAVLRQDRIWNCFAIADLAPPFREYSRISSAVKVPGDGTRQPNTPSTGSQAACLILRHPQFAVISPYGPEAGVAEILAQLDARHELPAHALLQSQGVHRSVLEKTYRPLTPWRCLFRMAVSAKSFVPPAGLGHRVGQTTMERLTPADARELLELYRLFPESTFRADQLEHGVFFGLRAENRLLAVAGTHVVAPSFRMAVVGGIFTHPEARGRGYARAVTAALVAELLHLGCRDVVLNVVSDNDPAIRLYDSLGFQTYCRYGSVEAADRLGGRAGGENPSR